MPAVFVIGRVVFVLYFIFAGLQRLMNIAASADYFAQKFAIPAALAGLSTRLESIIGLSTPQILVLFAGAIELAAGLLLAFNVGTRAMAIVLIIITAVSVYYGNNFWTMFDGQRDINLIEAMLQISLLGALIVFVALGSLRPGEPGRQHDVK
jgi:putative oxidoreductase